MATILRKTSINNFCNLFVIWALTVQISHQYRTTYLSLLLTFRALIFINIFLFFQKVHNFTIPSAFCTRPLPSRMQYTSKYDEMRLRTGNRCDTGTCYRQRENVSLGPQLVTKRGSQDVKQKPVFNALGQWAMDSTTSP
jgi:hypothetical protein